MVRIAAILVLFFSVFSALAQRDKELGIMLGGSYYLGDLNPRTQFKMTQPAIGGFYRLVSNKRYAFRLTGWYGHVAGDDAKSKDAAQKLRNLSFKSHILELSTQIEFNFFEYEPGNMKQDKASPYVFVGLGYFNMNPKASLNGEWHKLQPLRTEGRSEYSLHQISMPFGLGLKVNLTERMALGLEWGLRKTFTDYLDDVSTVYIDPDALAAGGGNLAVQLADRSEGGVSNTGRQRGNSRTKDMYSFAGLTLTFIIPGDEPCPGINSY